MSPFGFSTTADEVVDALPSQVLGRTFLITGPSAGSLGAGTAVALARQSPAHVILFGRSRSKVEAEINQIAAVNPAVKTSFVSCDLSDFDSVREAAREINSNTAVPHLDVIINNAGVMNVKEYTLGKQGNELTLSANHLGHYLLTKLLLPKVLAAGPGARIISVTSDGYRVSPFRFDDPNFSGGKMYDGWTAYGQSKTAIILFISELARRLEGSGVRAFSVQPGAIATNLATHLTEQDFADVNPVALRNTGRLYMDGQFHFKSVEQGVAPILAAAIDPALDEFSGSYIEDCQVRSVLDYAADPRNAKQCWTVTEGLIGESFDL